MKKEEENTAGTFLSMEGESSPGNSLGKKREERGTAEQKEAESRKKGSKKKT